jgi:hypothetical protein
MPSAFSRRSGRAFLGIAVRRRRTLPPGLEPLEDRPLPSSTATGPLDNGDNNNPAGQDLSATASGASENTSGLSRDAKPS